MMQSGFTTAQLWQQINAVLEALRAPKAPQPCRACGVMVPTKDAWWVPDCPVVSDGLHDVPGYLKLPHEEANDGTKM